MAKLQETSENSDVTFKPNSKKRFPVLQHWQFINLILMIYDVLAINLSGFLAIWIRYDFKFSAVPKYYFSAICRFAPIYTVCCIAVFFLCKIYQSIWRFASFNELLRIAAASIAAFIIQLIGITFLFERMPVSYYFLESVLQFSFVLMVRFSYRFVNLLRESRSDKSQCQNAMIIGAGEAGQILLRDIRHSKQYHVKVCCFIDDNQNKLNRYIDGVPVVGSRNDIFLAVEKYNISVIYLAIPSATMEQQREILNICSQTGCKLRLLQGIRTSLNESSIATKLKDVDIEDLLGRETIHTDMSDVYSFLIGKTVLVTGGGGSIGSELCRQIAAHRPKRLIIFDIYENSTYDIQLELKSKYPSLDLITLIGSVRDSRRLDYIFGKYRPDVVYHAAAHKHVPLMEDSPCESIKNNAVGTYKTAYAAMIHGCKRFVLISTDKAVNPTNIMGASKRLCEMIIQSFDSKIKNGQAEDIPSLYTHFCNDTEDIYTPDSVALSHAHTEFVAVRFGNVLGSNGSVVPLFKRQIAEGGPITVTHPDIIRYFMTIPEAVSLVLQAGTFARGGEIFVLDMGAPVKIDTLARNLIRLSGLRPDIDIKIEYTGLRPGEKLYEEKLMAEEGLKKTRNDLIHIGCPIPFDTDEFLYSMEKLMAAAYANDERKVREMTAETVKTYHAYGEEQKVKVSV